MVGYVIHVQGMELVKMDFVNVKKIITMMVHPNALLPVHQLPMVKYVLEEDYVNYLDPHLVVYVRVDGEDQTVLQLVPVQKKVLEHVMVMEHV